MDPASEVKEKYGPAGLFLLESILGGRELARHARSHCRHLADEVAEFSSHSAAAMAVIGGLPPRSTAEIVRIAVRIISGEVEE